MTWGCLILIAVLLVLWCLIEDPATKAAKEQAYQYKRALQTIGMGFCEHTARHTFAPDHEHCPVCSARKAIGWPP